MKASHGWLRWSLELIGASVAVLVAACGGGDAAVPDTQNQSARMNAMAVSASDTATACSNCIVGPLTLVRAKGIPSAVSFSVAGDAQADYVADINDNGSVGANSEVLLDGVVLLAARENSSSEPRHMVLNVRLSARSVLTARLTGKPGSTLTISIRSGAKLVGPEGGVIEAPGGLARLDIPAGALSALTELDIAPAGAVPPGNLGPAFAVLPTGTSFLKPVTLSVVFDIESVAPEWSEAGLTIARAEGAAWQDLPTTVDIPAKRLSTKLHHFSDYGVKMADLNAVSTPDSRRWSVADPWNSSHCWNSSDNTYNALLGTLAQQLFKLAAPPTTGVGCITEPYLANGYSYYIASNENHAGIDFRVKTDPDDGLTARNVYALADGVVQFESLDATHSTLTVRSLVNGKTYHILYVHCESHEQVRDGVSLGRLAVGSAVLKGDQVCKSGSIGAAGAHLHFEVKEVAMPSPLRAIFGERDCLALSFEHGWSSVTSLFDKFTQPGCPLAFIRTNTVDPTVLVEPVVRTPTLLATGFPNITSIASDGTYIYFGTINGQLWRTTMAGGDQRNIANVPGFIGQILFHAQNIWFYAQAGAFATASIYVMPRDLSAGPRTFLSGVVKSMGIVGSTLYYWDGDDAVKSIPLSGGTPELLLPHAGVLGFAVDGTSIFLQTGGFGVFRLDTVTKTLSSVIPQVSGSSNVLVDANYVYGGAGSDGQIAGGQGNSVWYQAPKQGGTVVPLVSSPLSVGHFRGGLLSDGSFAYYLEGPGGYASSDTLKAIPVNGGTPSVIAEGVSIRIMIKVDGVFYWCTTAATGASIYRLP